MNLPRFYPIFDSAAWVARVLPLGVKFLQLRIKDGTEAQIRAEVAKSHALCHAAGAALVVNDHWRIALEEGCDWLHLGQEDLEDADLAAIRSAGIKLGISTHDEAELARALVLQPEYIALGPIWPTILKKMRFAPQGLSRIRDWKDRIGTIPLVAIGGLTPERGAAALEAGADAVSVVTDITLNSDPESRIRDWLRVTR